MNHAERAALIERLFNEGAGIMVDKGRDYSGNETNSNGDANANFKRVAEALNLTPAQVAHVYLLKHLDSISTYLKTGEVTSEPIKGRILDAINYLYILASLLDEAGELEAPTATLEEQAEGVFLAFDPNDLKMPEADGDKRYHTLPNGGWTSHFLSRSCALCTLEDKPLGGADVEAPTATA